MARGRQPALYTREGTEEVRSIMNRLLTTFKGKFHDINPEFVDIIFKDTPNSKYEADVKLVRGLYTAYSNKKINLILHRGSWASSDDYQKALMLYKQLMRVFYDDDKKAYRIRNYDVQTFSELLQDFGLNFEKAKDVFDRVVNVD